MRYDKGHKEATRRRIVETATARFRKDGIDGIGVADLMAETGLTHGGFYSHFSSKEDLVRATLDEAATQAQARFDRLVAEGGLEAWIRFYMRCSHRDHPETGCTLASLAAELSRHPAATKTVFTGLVNRLITNVESKLPGTGSKADRRKRAAGIFAAMMGALQMARTVNDPVLSDEILNAGIDSALVLAGIKSS